ncbi:MAG: hypothetical protein EON95_06430 [Caulobacteraceae bacterium]|nr:hypothetical protein [Caulobacter sp.]RYF94146.1 MAG: hypothetical protein EON95_06430 [Caulobacteraceae bacterium]
MAEADNTPEDTTFHTSTPEANRAAHAGQGVGARELGAMKDPGEDLPVIADDEAEDAQEAPDQD